MDRKELFDKIRDMIADSVSDIFREIAEGTGIHTEDIPSEFEYDIDSAEEDLTEVIMKAIDTQF